MSVLEWRQVGQGYTSHNLGVGYSMLLQAGRQIVWFSELGFPSMQRMLIFAVLCVDCAGVPLVPKMWLSLQMICSLLRAYLVYSLIAFDRFATIVYSARRVKLDFHIKSASSCLQKSHNCLYFAYRYRDHTTKLLKVWVWLPVNTGHCFDHQVWLFDMWFCIHYQYCDKHRTKKKKASSYGVFIYVVGTGMNRRTAAVSFMPDYL